jgi:nitrogen fixation/metabolism regulation signal transduction histidine kinase
VIKTSYDAEHHRVTVSVPDDGKGFTFELAD